MRDDGEKMSGVTLQRGTENRNVTLAKIEAAIISAAQPDDRISIGGLEEIERGLPPAPWPSMTWWSAHDRAEIALRNAAPALIAIATALLEWQAIHVAVDALPDYLDPMDPETAAIGEIMIAAWRDVESAMSKVRA